MEMEQPYFGESMGINNPGSFYGMGFAGFSITMGYWWEDANIPYVIK